MNPRIWNSRFFGVLIALFLVLPLSASAATATPKVTLFEKILINPLATLFEPLFAQPVTKTIVIKPVKQTDAGQVAGTSTAPLIITASGMSKDEILSYINSSLANVSSSAPTIQNISNTYVRSGSSQGLANTSGRSFAEMQAQIDGLANRLSTAGLTVSGSSYFSGNVGIGTSTPSSPLYVYSDGYNPLIVKSGSDYAELHLDSAAGLIPNIKFKAGGTGVFEMGAEADGFYLNNNVNAGSGGAALFISTGNRIGVGTTTPWGKLSVNPNALGSGVPAFVVGSSTKTHFIVDGAGKVMVGTPVAVGGDKQFQVYTTTLDSAFEARVGRTTGSNFAVNGTAIGIGATTNYALYGWASGATNNYGLYVESGTSYLNSFTGIGTTTPTYKLTVADSATSQLTLSDRAGIAQWAFRNAGGNFYLSTTTVAGTATTSSSAITVLGSNGFVGIGKTNPEAKLDLGNGDFYTTSNSNTSGDGGSYWMIFRRSRGTEASPTTAQIGDEAGVLAAKAYDGNAYRNVGQIRFSVDDTIDTSNVTGRIVFYTGRFETERMRLNNTGLGIGTSTPWKKLSVNGGVAVPALSNGSTGYYACVNTTTGELSTSTTACGASSQKYKENISDLSYGLNEVLKLRPVSFDYKDTYLKNARRQVGFIAEEVATVTPEVVAYDDQGEIQGLDYPKFTAIIVKAIQDLYSRMDSLITERIEYIQETRIEKLTIGEKFCVKTTCIDVDQLERLILQSGVGATQASSAIQATPTQSSSTSTSTATTTDTFINQSTSTPEVTTVENISTTTATSTQIDQ